METSANMVYKVTKSNMVRGVTTGVWVLVVAVFAAVWYMMLRETFDVVAFTVTLVVTLAVLACLLCFLLMSPRRIGLTADALVLHRVQGRKVFRYADIADAGLWTGKPSSLFRFCGSGAFYGFIGWFSGGGLGRHFEYVGCYDDAFYIRLRSGRTYLLSCDGSAQAVKRLRECMQGKAA